MSCTDVAYAAVGFASDACYLPMSGVFCYRSTRALCDVRYWPSAVQYCHTVCFYALATRRPLLTWRRALRSCYAHATTSPVLSSCTVLPERSTSKEGAKSVEDCTCNVGHFEVPYCHSY
eukprot:648123-Rhodomonas_salina.2